MSYPRLSRDRVEAFVRQFASARVCVFGDVMLDRYFWGEADRISPEAPVPVVRVTRRSVRLGGAANVASNLRALGVHVGLAGVVGEDREGEEFRELLATDGIDAAGIVSAGGRETTEKVRIIARNQQVVRADFETVDGIPDTVAAGLYDALAGAASDFDALVISDYGKGVVRAGAVGDAIASWRAADKPVLVDPHVPHFRWYRGASLVTPNAREAREATGITFRDGATAGRAREVIDELGLSALLVTRGEDGMSLFGADGVEVHIPTVAKEVYDVTGAGDTVIGVLAAGLAIGADLIESVVLANQAAGEVVKEVGTSPITSDVLVGAFA